jgi:lysozyme
MSGGAESLWKSPLIVAIFAAAVAALGNAGVVFENASSQRTLEKQKAESARLLEAIKTGDPDAAAVNLRFLVATGLVTDPNVREKLGAYLHQRKPGSGPVLPATTGAAKFISKFESTVLKPFKDSGGLDTIGSGHVLSPHELRTGKLLIGSKMVPFREGITRDQANQLLAQDLALYRKKIESLVTVPLSDNQADALTSFVHNVGWSALRRDGMLKKLNAGRYDDVPRLMMRWVHDPFGRTLAGLVARRRSEVALWNGR